MPAALIPIAGAVIGGVMSNRAANTQADATRDAAQQSAEAARAATQLQRDVYNQTREDQTPWREAGKNALGQLVTGTNSPDASYVRSFGMSDYEADPGYGFRLSEGLKAIQNSSAARGGLLSGAALKGISRYGQDMASQEYQNAYNRYQSNQTNAYNRLASMAGLGQTANNALNTAGSNFANNAGNIMLGDAANQGNAALAAGNARASAYQGYGNSLGRVNWGDVSTSFNNGGGYNGLGADTQNNGVGMGSAGRGLGAYNEEGYGGGGV